MPLLICNNLLAFHLRLAPRTPWHPTPVCNLECSEVCLSATEATLGGNPGRNVYLWHFHDIQMTFMQVEKRAHATSETHWHPTSGRLQLCQQARH